MHGYLNTVKILLLTVFVSFSASSCKFDLNEASYKNPRNLLGRADYPFNYIAPKKSSQNSIGFYSGETMYIQLMAPILASMINHEDIVHLYYFLPSEKSISEGSREGNRDYDSIRDTLEIAACIAPYPAQFEGTLDTHKRYFYSIRFLINKKKVDSNGRIVLSGDEIVLKDQKGSKYKVHSGALTFENDLSEPYNLGGFEVEYEHLNGTADKLRGGRFKMFRRGKAVDCAKDFFVLDPSGESSYGEPIDD